MIRINKRGVSALVSSLILLVSAIGIGIGLINLGKAAVELGAECSINASLTFSVIDNKPQVCYKENGQVYFSVDNGQIIDINKVKVRAIDQKRRAQEFEVDQTSITRSGNLEREVQFQGLERVIQLRITPIIKFYDQVQICDEKSITFDDLKPCGDIAR